MSRLIDKILSSHGLKRQKHVIGSAKQTFFSLNNPSMYFFFSSSIFKIAFPKWLITNKVLQSLLFKIFFHPKCRYCLFGRFRKRIIAWSPHMLKAWPKVHRFVKLISNLTFKTSIILQLQHFLSWSTVFFFSQND